jgi:hypothetical protein
MLFMEIYSLYMFNTGARIAQYSNLLWAGWARVPNLLAAKFSRPLQIAPRPF